MMKVQLRYSLTRLLLTGLGTVIGTEQTFRLNSLFDPDLTNVGHQPFGFDQLTPLYGSYRVLGCRARMEFYASNADDLIVFFTVQSGQNTTALTSSNVDAAMERQSVMHRALPTTGQNRYVHDEYFPIHAVEGLPREMVNFNSAYQSTVSTSPANQAYLRLAAGTAFSDSKNCEVSIMLVFDAIMFDRISMPQS